MEYYRNPLVGLVHIMEHRDEFARLQIPPAPADDLQAMATYTTIGDYVLSKGVACPLPPQHSWILFHRMQPLFERHLALREVGGVEITPPTTIAE